VIDPDDLPSASRTHPEWVRREGFTFIGDWVGPLYVRRAGGAVSPDDGGLAAMREDPETVVRNAAAVGCNCIILSCSLDLSVTAPQDPLEEGASHICGYRPSVIASPPPAGPQADDEAISKGTN